MQDADLQPYLRPGTNVLAVWPAFGEDAVPLMHGAAVMVSGETVPLNTDPDWRYVPRLVPGWDAAGYAGPSEPVTNLLDGSASQVPAELTAIHYGYRLYLLYTQEMPAYAGRLLLAAPDDDAL